MGKRVLHSDPRSKAGTAVAVSITIWPKRWSFCCPFTCCRWSCAEPIWRREINYWLGLVLMLIVLALGLTGFPLPWDQKGYWATKVATELLSSFRRGQTFQKLVVGGPDYGHTTLTRFFALHAGVLPVRSSGSWLCTWPCSANMGSPRFRPPHGPTNTSGPCKFSKIQPRCLVMLIVVLVIVLSASRIGSAPRNRPSSTEPLDPEWYFLFLFQLLKKFDNPSSSAANCRSWF